MKLSCRCYDHPCGVALIALVVFFCVGCHTYNFLPNEIITSENAGRLKLFYYQKFGQQVIDPDVVQLFSYPEVDLQSRSIYFGRTYWANSLINWPTGLFQHDLKTGLVVRKTRIPTHADLSGAGAASREGILIRPADSIAILERRLGDKKEQILVGLDLKKDAPWQLLKNARLALQPVQNEHGVLIVGEESLYLYNTITRTMEWEIPLPDPAFSQYEQYRWYGAFGSYVLAVKVDKVEKLNKLICFDTSSGCLKSVNELESSLGNGIQGVLTDKVHQRALVTMGGSAWTVAYDVPTFKEIYRSTLPKNGRLMPPQGWGIHVEQAEDGKYLVAHDAQAQKEMLRIKLEDQGFFSDSWFPIVSEDGKVVGAYSANSVRLYGVSRY